MLKLLAAPGALLGAIYVGLEFFFNLFYRGQFNMTSCILMVMFFTVWILILMEIFSENKPAATVRYHLFMEDGKWICDDIFEHHRGSGDTAMDALRDVMNKASPTIYE